MVHLNVSNQVVLLVENVMTYLPRIFQHVGSPRKILEAKASC